MTKYSQYLRGPQSKSRPWQVHPIWRGIGCVLLVVMPVMAYAGAVLLVEANRRENWLPLAPALMQPIRLPWIGIIPHLIATLLTALVLLLVGFAVLMAVYALVYRFAGPPQYGPLDAPPETWRKKRR